MKDFKKGNRFGASGGRGGFNKGGYDRGAPRDDGGFRGAPKRDFSARPIEMHQATCARCNKACEVPFRPNGRKPVFCKDCFASNRPDAASNTHAFSRTNDATRPPRHTEGAAPRTNDLGPQVEAINTKLDMLVRMVKALENTSATKKEEAQAVETVEKVKVSARKSVKKAAKK